MIYHTDSLLRKHRLLVAQDGDKFSLVDQQTGKRASETRTTAYFEELEPEVETTSDVWNFA